MAKPIFCATHPRACSTAFERVFMTRKDLACVHEPFGDAFYYGPERLGGRYEQDEEARKESGFEQSTYKTIFERLDREASEGKRLFIKDITHYLIPPEQQLARLAPSLQPKRRGIGTTAAPPATNGVAKLNGVGEPNGAPNGTPNGGLNGDAPGRPPPPFPYATDQEAGNPTVIPKSLLERFHFTFLIRDPHSSIPSYYRCTIPPLDAVTGFYDFFPCEAGYDELRRFFDYARDAGLVGKHIAGEANGTNGINGTAAGNGGDQIETCVIDADDLLDDPAGVIKAYCKTVGLDFNPDMLNWDNEEDQRNAKKAFEKWKGFHEDAIDSKDLKPRNHVSSQPAMPAPTPPTESGQQKASKTEAEWDAEWRAKYGAKAAKLIRDTVDQNMPDYLYLKQFALSA